MSLIKKIEIKGLFKRHQLEWTLNSDVNILVGINGVGKTSILRSINSLLSKKYYYLRDLEMDVELLLSDNTEVAYYGNSKRINKNQVQPNFEYVTTFDVPLKDKTKIKQSETPLDKELEQVIYTLGKENQKSFSNYRFKA
ncbi:MAG: AAA family ATPase, partial [Tannerella sp.]|nr:AAA family ATPase [Tannerella sp.]